MEYRIKHLLLIFLIVVMSAKAQSPKIYLNEYGSECTQDEATFYKIREFKNGGKKTIDYTYSLDGILSSRTDYEGSEALIIKRHIQYRDDETEDYVMNYENGELLPVRCFMKVSGKRVSCDQKKKNGIWLEEYEHGYLTRAEGEYLRGKRQGVWSFEEGGVLASKDVCQWNTQWSIYKVDGRAFRSKGI